jgi:hypothetical protein
MSNDIKIYVGLQLLVLALGAFCAIEFGSLIILALVSLSALWMLAPFWLDALRRKIGARKSKPKNGQPN